MTTRDPHVLATRIVRDAGGELVGRTRLQKVAYLTQLAGFSADFRFEYRHYGPFSEDLARGVEIASAFGDIQEEERRAEWGGRYSIYRTPGTPTSPDDQRAAFVRKAAEIGAIELELAATAAYLYAVEKLPAAEAWRETARRKPEKAEGGRLDAAKRAYGLLTRLPTPRPLPSIV
jgi:uncharacterized protein